MLVVATVWLIKAAVCRRQLRCLRRGSCCSHTSHLSLAYIAPAVLATCRSYTLHSPFPYIARIYFQYAAMPSYYLRTLLSYYPIILLPFSPTSSYTSSSTLAVAKTEGQYTKIYMSVVNTCRALLHDRELEVELPRTLCSLRPPLNLRAGATQRQLRGSRPARMRGGGEEGGHRKAQDKCTSAACLGLECAA